MGDIKTDQSFPKEKLFTKHENPLTLMSVLAERLPFSCCLVNQLTVYEPFKEDFDAYTIHDPLTGQTVDDIWILFCFRRKDWGKVITISPPVPVSKGLTELSHGIKHALEFIPSFNWDEPFLLMDLALPISDFLIQFNIRQRGNAVKLYPCYLFYLEMEDALNSSIPSIPGTTVGPIELEPAVELFRAHWSYFKPESEEFFRKSIPNCVSSAVYLSDGTMICAAFAAPYGNICTLVTHPNHRRKGYATLAMRYLFREMARKGLHPVWETYVTNYCGLGLHMSLNPKIACKVDYICHKAM